MQNHSNGTNKVFTKTQNVLTEIDEDWSYATKEILDTLPQPWTRGLLYFLIIFIAIIIPWSILSKIDETGTARGRIEPKEETVKLDAAVTGTVSEIPVQEGDFVKAGQVLLILESNLVKSELKQAQDKLEGQLNRLNQLNILKSQLILVLSTQQQQNKAIELEKQTQIDQYRESLETLIDTNELLEYEKKAQLSQAEAILKNSEIAYKLAEIRLANAQREIKRYQNAWQEGIVAETKVAEQEDITKEKQRIYEQTKSDIEQAKLRLAEQNSVYQKSIIQAKSDIEQAKLRLQEENISLQTLKHSNQLSVLKIKEQIRTNYTDIATIKSEIAQTESQINSLTFQLSQHSLKAPISGIIFQLPIQTAGTVVEQGTPIAEISANNHSLIVRAEIPTANSGFLKPGLIVKLKFDAYPFQDYGIVEGKLLKVSPTTSLIETPNGKVEAYKLEIGINKTCIETAHQCIPLRPGDTVTAEVIVHQRRIIDLVLDPFKKLQKGGLNL